jgi:hypothetical protein
MGPHVVRENRYWRLLLERIAQDMERTAAREADPKRERWLRSRALRIRQRLHAGVPDGWKMT